MAVDKKLLEEIQKMPVEQQAELIGSLKLQVEDANGKAEKYKTSLDDLATENEILRSKLAATNDKDIVNVTSAQIRKFGKVLSDVNAIVKGTFTIDEKELKIIPGINKIRYPKFKVKMLKLSDKESVEVINGFGKIDLQTIVDYAPSVPKFKELLEDLYEAKANIFADVKTGLPLFSASKEEEETIVKIENN